MAVTVDVYGSCVSKDVFRYVSPGKYTFRRCVTQTPISTLYEPAFQFQAEHVDGMQMSKYEKTIFKVQTQKVLPQILRKNKSDILVIDLADELMERCRIKTDLKSETTGQIAQLLGREEEYERLLNSEPHYTLEARFHPQEMDLRVIEKKYRKFASEILYSASNPQGYKPEQIIVIEALCASDILGNDGNIHQHNKKYRVKEGNEWLKKLYEMLYRFLPGCTVIRMPDFLHSSENHINGVHPLHYMPENYYYIERTLDVINHYSNVNSLENLRREQSLRNKLDTRVVHTMMMYDLQRQIRDLQKKIDIIEKKK